MNGDPMDMFDEMDEMFSRLFSQMSRELTTGRPRAYGYQIIISGDDPSPRMAEVPASPARAAREPVAEVHRVGDETKVITELPGATGESIRLEVTGRTLVSDAGDAENHYRTVADLPPVDEASMTRSFRNGVLEVSFRNLPESSEPPAAGES